MFSTPPSICFSGPSDVFVPGLILGSGLAAVLKGSAAAEPMIASCAAATVRPAAPRKRRRSRLMSSVIVSIGHLIDSRLSVGSAEREREGFHIRIEELNFELPVDDRFLLPDQLIEPLLGDRA